MSLYFIIMATIGLICGVYLIFSGMAGIISKRVADDVTNRLKSEMKHGE
ncbi:MAG TPA: hypothetical protein PK079_05720 [Leptospiraceae bacterium]|nr:hypothetical protein [Leptospiraceae bacterium]HMW05008.1 hypothetical protein [Leptospiraceae bacterium]HMX31452.1 hypothetical protein [Leptospiraceae bacterium]HMY33562.1 hypothetical protein [Leptospiraceae bacterium]HMZ67006.1 hypothetical protein [Leptospiraceae bacterium]